MREKLQWLKQKFQRLLLLIKKLLIIVLSIFLAFQLAVFASLFYWRTNPIETTMFMRWTYYLGGNLNQGIQHEWRDWEEISPYMAQAIIASEDTRFVKHNGFDWHSIENALINNQRHGTVVRGGSTISQQLAKNLYLTNHRSLLRKGQEAIITIMMELLWSKKRILEVYMNSVEFGDHIYGVETASLYYFGHSAKHLTREQAAFLAAILPQPRYYQKNRNNAKLKQRQRVILKRMNNSFVPKE